MSYFLITHPRSGSSTLSVAISKTMSETTPTWNLDEFFHMNVTQLWGDYKKILNYKMNTGIVYSLKNLTEIPNLSGNISSSFINM
jgi:hypothetical protein